MLSLSYDMHLHSCLSPCGDADMVPGNIAGMAMIKELQVVALTDHNTARNCPAFLKNAEEYGLIAIPGMEVTTSEEIHVLAYFKRLEAALDFDRYIYEHLNKVKNKPEIFGEQLIVDENGSVTSNEDILLIGATDISYDEILEKVGHFDGVAVPAHINKSSTSVISQLGMFDFNQGFKAAELFAKDEAGCLELEPQLKQAGITVLRSSDAHYLEHINEAINRFHVNEPTVDDIFANLFEK